MKRNGFNEPQAEEGDDLTALYAEEYDSENASLTSSRETFEDSEWLDGWNCTVDDGQGNEMVVRGFASSEALETWLVGQGVKIEA